MTTYPMPPAWVLRALRKGLVIPAHPLALTRSRSLDEIHQRALTRYYYDAEAGGVAVGVHTTQFEIRHPKTRLFEPVLRLAAETLNVCEERHSRQLVRIGGICGRTAQALAEAQFLRETGYHAGLLSLAAFSADPESVILQHCRTVAREIPLFGFYLQPAVGGRRLSINFWRGFAEIPNAIAIKIAPFNRYQTLDVVRAVAEAGRADDIALYTGNDDTIVVDLLTEYRIAVGDRWIPQRIVGGLLGHWSCGTRRAVDLLETCHRYRTQPIPRRLLSLAAQVTDCNQALFDAANDYAGCIAGIHSVLRRQGLLKNLVCLDPKQRLSSGQQREIDRVHAAYPDLNDDDFVNQHLDRWLAD